MATSSEPRTGAREEDAATTERNVAAPPSSDPELRREKPAPRTAARSSPPAGSSDTLLSAPTPGSNDDEASRIRVEELGRRVDQLQDRVKVLELAGARLLPRWALWVLFLLALALVWQLARR